MRFKGIRLGKSKEESEEEIIEVDKATASQITEINEHISNRTKNLEETTQRLQELSEMLNDDDDEEERPRPHGPLKELSVEPEDKMMDIDMDTKSDDDLFEASADEVQLVEVGEVTAEQAQPAKDANPEEKPAEAAAESEEDSFSNLFGMEEEESNPLSTLINSLPDVSAQELMDDIQEIKNIIKDNRKK
jgi:hypothetical protein